MRRFWAVLLGTVVALAPMGQVQAAAAPASTSISITPSAVDVVAGKSVAVNGALSSGARPVAGLRVVLMSREDRAGSTFNAVAGATTAADGRYRFVIVGNKHLLYFVSFAGGAELGASRSATKSLRVRMGTPVNVSPEVPGIVASGDLRTFSGVVSPELKGRQLEIQSRTSTTGWRTVSRVQVVSQYALGKGPGYFKWSYRFSRPGVIVFRIVYPAIALQDGNISRSLSFSVQRWIVLKDLTPSATTGGLRVAGTNGRLGTQRFPNSLMLTRSASAGSVSFDLKRGCSAFAGAPVVYRGTPRDHSVRFLLKLDGTAAFDGTFRLDKQLNAVVVGHLKDKRTLEMVVAGPGTGLVDLWSGAQILCAW